MLVKNCGCKNIEGKITTCDTHTPDFETKENEMFIPKGSRSTIMLRIDTRKELDKRKKVLPTGREESYEDVIRDLLGLDVRRFKNGRPRKKNGTVE